MVVIIRSLFIIFSPDGKYIIVFLTVAPPPPLMLASLPPLKVVTPSPMAVATPPALQTDGSQFISDGGYSPTNGSKGTDEGGWLFSLL